MLPAPESTQSGKSSYADETEFYGNIRSVCYYVTVKKINDFFHNTSSAVMNQRLMGKIAIKGRVNTER